MNLVSGSFPLQTYRNINLSTTGVIVKGFKGYIHEYYFYNAHASAIRYVKMYDKATAATNSDTPIRTYPLAPNSGINLYVGEGVEFLTGISLRATTGVADNDNTAPGSNEVIVNVGYL